jgi:hypothetical protein
MAYLCDICSTSLASRSAGTFFDQSRVATSPGYWEYLCTNSFIPLTEDTIGLAVWQLCQDTSGYVVCDNCRDMLQRDMQLAREYGLEQYVTSIPSGEVDSHPVGMVAGTVWQKLHGTWPSTIQIGGGGPRGKLKVMKREAAQQGESASSQSPAPKKWWQFWK